MFFGQDLHDPARFHDHVVRQFSWRDQIRQIDFLMRREDLDALPMRVSNAAVDCQP